MKTQLLIALTFVTLFCKAQLNWTEIPSLSEGHFSPASFMVGTKFYVCGGLNSSLVGIGDTWEYDLTTNVWTQKAPLPAGVTMYGDKGFQIGGTGYITCGSESGGYTNTLYQYNPSNNSWTTKSPFPGSPRYTACQFSIGDYGYVGLGGNSPDESDIYKYDPEADTWTQMASFPGTPRQSAFCFVIGGSAYIGLGSDGTNPTDFYRFDTAGTGSWTQIASFPGIGRNSGASLAFNGIGYVMCGVNTSQTSMENDIWSYTPSTDTWTNIGTFPGGYRREVAYGAYDSVFIVGGGDTTAFGSGINGTFWETCFNGCYPAGIQTINTTASITCYPSPSTGNFYIDMSTMGNAEKQIAIYNELGQTVYNITTTENKLLYTNHISPGLYTIDVTSGKERSFAKVVITE